MSELYAYDNNKQSVCFMATNINFDHFEQQLIPSTLITLGVFSVSNLTLQNTLEQVKIVLRLKERKKPSFEHFVMIFHRVFSFPF